MNIQFRARDVAKAEKVLNMSIENIVADMKTTSLIELLRVGMVNENGGKLLIDKSDDELFDFVDQVFREQGKVEIMLQVIEALVDSGFLPRELKVAKFREKVQAAANTLAE